MEPDGTPQRLPVLVTVQIWNTVASSVVEYRGDWVRLTGALLEAVADDPEVRVRFAAEGTDWSLVEGGVRAAGTVADLDPFDAKSFVVTAVVPAERVERLEDRLEQLCIEWQVATMWVGAAERMCVLSHARPRRHVG